MPVVSTAERQYQLGAMHPVGNILWVLVGELTCHPWIALESLSEEKSANIRFIDLTLRTFQWEITEMLDGAVSVVNMPLHDGDL